MNKEVSVLLETLHPLERKVLPVLKQNISLKEIISLTNLQEVEVMRALQWLENKDIIKINSVPKQIISLDKNGLLYLEKGLPEKRFLKLLERPLRLDEIKQKSDLSEEEFQISLGVLRKKAAININNKVSITEQGKKILERDSLEEQFLKKLSKPLDLSKLTDEEKFAYNELKTRKQIIKTELIKDRTMQLTDLALQLQKHKIETKNIVDALTPEIIKQKTWKNKTFRRYDIKINVPKIYPAKKQLYRRFLDEIRQKFMSLGFEEMFSPIVETEFWDMDSLFMPQFHSARDIHSAYLIKEPKYGTIPKNLLQKVKQQHEKSWQYKFDEKQSSRLILRTQGTAASSRMLASSPKIPGKYFAISRCFRPDVVDATHLADFNQVEGIVLEENLNLKHLFGLLKLFAKEFAGAEKIKIVPGYFPFTEPSCELHAYKKGLGWIELGGAGILREEVTKPLGVKVPVLAWGLGIDRLAMFKLG